MMPPLSLSAELVRPLRYLLTDVDDTVTTDGQLLPQTYQALHNLKDAGFHLIPVTGGCAGWCDQIARIWPVSAVIGENGALYIRRDENGHLRYHHWQDPAEQRSSQERTLDIATGILDSCAHLRLAKDQPYRLADVALDYNQDVPHAPREEVDFALNAFRRADINAKASSIHINAWIGDFNKAAAARRMLAEAFGLDEAAMREQVLYAGDAPNDEPMFEFFPHSVGMANISQHWDGLTHRPAYVTEGVSGHGFVELAEALLAA